MNKTTLKLDWCSHEAATFAVMHWHYSKAMPAGKSVKVGVWEDKRFIGVVIFSKGAAPQSHCPYQIKNTQICELTRISLSRHKTPVSKIVSIAIKMLVKQSPNLRLIVSYADPEQGHNGSIYAAGNWIYVGATKPCEHFVNAITGERIHSKTLKTGRRGLATEMKKNNLIRSIKSWKHKYLMPLDDEMRAKIKPLSKPYPKRAGSAASGTSINQIEREGATPIPALSSYTEDGGV